MSPKRTRYRFSFGPWNIDEGADPFGPPVRKPAELGRKIKALKKLGYDGMQFHDDDAVPELDSKSPAQITRTARALRKVLDGEGIEAEFVAPRLWFAPETADGAYTSPNKAHRRYAIERSKKALDIGNELGTHTMVLWFAREGTYIRESKIARESIFYLRDAMNALLDYDSNVRLLVEPKPNEPVDSALISTAGHALALCYLVSDTDRAGILIESAHSVLAGLDPSDDMAFALAHGKLWSVHLNDQGNMKFDQDKSFGSYNLRRAFNQVRVLEEAGYANNGGWIGFDVKAMRTQKDALPTQHLANSLAMFNDLVQKVRSLNKKTEAKLLAARDYEGLERFILCHLMGKRFT